VIKISEIKTNPNNPRFIKDEKFKKLCNSIKDFSKMMELRPIIVDSEMMILGGNMRYRAVKELGYKEIPDEWVKIADKLTEEEKNRFIIEDNMGFGEWDFEVLANAFEMTDLVEWGFEPSELSFGEATKEDDQKSKDKKPMVCPECGAEF